MDNLPDDVRSVLKGKNVEDIALKVRYKNHRGEVAERKIIPLKIYFGEVEFHNGEQWLMDVYDLDKKAYRTYALRDIQEWIRVP